MIRTLALVAIALVLAGCSKKQMRQASSNMEPTIKKDEVVTVDFSAYTNSDPERWDVIVFEPPTSNESQWLGRVVGLPGETVDLRSGAIVINGQKMNLPPHLSIGEYVIPKMDAQSVAPDPITYPYKIPKGRYFVLGDNVSNSLDSRYWGGLDELKILGKVPGK